MGAGDVLIIGPYATNSTGMGEADSALSGLTQTDSASDKIMIIPAANGLEFWILNVEGA